MSIFHQIYCTHCTHGSSALERGEGERASQILGYSARAGSLEGDQLRRYYQQIEPYLYYFLPQDTTDAQKLDLSAATAVRRMFYVPPRNGLSILGQVCYRPTDCEGRPGSYFAHVLICEDRDGAPSTEAGPPAAANAGAEPNAADAAATNPPTTAGDVPQETAPAEGGDLVLQSTADTPVEQEDWHEADAAANGAADAAAVIAPAETADASAPADAPSAPAPPSPAALRWSALDCLRLWNAPGWVLEDSSTIPFRLPSIQSFDVLCAPSGPAIDEAVLAGFLTEPGDSPDFVDPAGVVPARWRVMEPQRRADLFGEFFTAFVHSHGSAKPVVLAAEPGVAALMFFGVARMLPPGDIREAIGFSTFEAVAERVQQTLAATWVANPDASDETLKAPWPGVLVRTIGPAPAKTAPLSLYVATVIQRVRQRGWQSVDHLLDALSAGKIQKAEQLDVLTAVHRAVTMLLETGSFPNEPWRKLPYAIDFLRKELGRRLASVADPAATMKAIVGGASHLAVLDLLASKGAPLGTRRAVVHLLQKTPAQKILGLLRLAGVSDEDKLVVLARHVHEEGELPLGCEFLRDEWIAAEDAPKRAGAVLMSRLVAKLSPKDLARVHAGSPKNQSLGFVLSLVRMYRRKKLKAASLAGVIANMEEEPFYQLLRSAGPDFLRNYPEDEKAMGEKLAEMLGSLPKHPVDFRERLEFILVGQQLLPDEQQRIAAAAWSTCLQLIPKVAQLQKVDANTKLESRLTLLNSNCRDMAKAADVAMSLDMIDETMDWGQKREALLKIAQNVLGGTPLLAKGVWESDALLERIAVQLQHHRWPQDPLKKEVVAKKKEGPRRLVGPEAKSPTSNWLLVLASLIGIVALMAIVVGAVWWFMYGRPGPKPEDRDPRRKKTKRNAPAASAGAVAWHIRLPQTGDDLQTGLPAASPGTGNHGEDLSQA